MGHVVHHVDAAGQPQLEDVASLEAALARAEELRNDAGVEQVRIFREIRTQVRTYYKVVAVDDEPTPAGDATPSSDAEAASAQDVEAAAIPQPDAGATPEAPGPDAAPAEDAAASADAPADSGSGSEPGAEPGAASGAERPDLDAVRETLRPTTEPPPGAMPLTPPQVRVHPDVADGGEAAAPAEDPPSPPSRRPSFIPRGH